VAAFVRPADPVAPPTAAELRTHLRGHLSPQKTPTHWYAVDAFPLTGAIREAWEKGLYADRELPIDQARRSP
jgi:fatty-acyl-CoA synthase